MAAVPRLFLERLAPLRAAPAAAVFLALAWLLASGSARAQCSRVISMPVAPTGFNALVKGEQVQGVYPDLMRQIGDRLDCDFTFPVVPRARLALMFFDSREADLFLPASRTAERDRKAVFVPMLKLTPTLITLKAGNKEAPPSDLRGLLARSSWRAAVVRSYTWGDEYDALLRQLEADKRVDYVADLRTVLLMLRSGRVEFSILPPTLLYSAVHAPGPDQEALPQLAAIDDMRFQSLGGLPRSEVGAYLSTQSLSPADLALLREGLARAARDGTLLRSLQRYYPAEILRADVGLGP